jgi:hypothetical protein
MTNYRVGTNANGGSSETTQNKTNKKTTEITTTKTRKIEHLRILTAKYE